MRQKLWLVRRRRSEYWFLTLTTSYLPPVNASNTEHWAVVTHSQMPSSCGLGSEIPLTLLRLTPRCQSILPPRMPTVGCVTGHQATSCTKTPHILLRFRNPALNPCYDFQVEFFRKRRGIAKCVTIWNKSFPDGLCTVLNISLPLQAKVFALESRT